jgi:hypothetical protein
VAVPLAALGLPGWYVTVRQAREMSGMITGLGQVGTHMPNDMAVPAFMAEKNWRHGVLVTRVAGSGVVALGVAVAAVPSLLSAISR